MARSGVHKESEDPLDYSTFMTNMIECLSDKGWSEIQGYPKKFGLALTREESATVVTTRRVIAFLKGDGLSRAEIQEAVEEAHKLMKEKAVPPLFPATTVLVFVFDKADDPEWMLKKAKKKDVLRSKYTFSWVVDLTESTLEKHKGLPLIKSGEPEIRKALACSKSFHVKQQSWR